MNLPGTALSKAARAVFYFFARSLEVKCFHFVPKLELGFNDPKPIGTLAEIKIIHSVGHRDTFSTWVLM